VWISGVIPCAARREAIGLGRQALDGSMISIQVVQKVNQVSGLYPDFSLCSDLICIIGLQIFISEFLRRIGLSMHMCNWTEM
jgi:hypothetical protein